MSSQEELIGYTGENALEEYISAHIEPEGDLLKSLYRETNIKLLNPRMASGHIQGRLLKSFVQMIQPKNVLELGTFTGYATLCMAEGLPENGHIDTIEIDDELEGFIKKWIDKSPYKDKITLHIGDAVKVVPALNKKFDLVFLDAEKREYPDYYKQLFDYVELGGYIIADNTLWDGHVVDPEYSKDKQTKAIKEFNDMVAADSRVSVSIVPIRDGLTIIRRNI
ncbi:MAG: class I SAM-dependent methyltransferase [Bacteroidaceae bacterium]|nr:class I SAM-dependent methyltransferase [Bacteroidaceae bacterium]MBO5951936.1 class I SAM-dependent methyltransferase [Bacteroidaceae bacterium]